ncbi:3474_t:CDS:1, partial [Cetraspora pellucida]
LVLESESPKNTSKIDKQVPKLPHFTPISTYPKLYNSILSSNNDQIIYNQQVVSTSHMQQVLEK